MEQRDFQALLDYSKDQRYKTLLNVAVPSGMWQNAEDIICDDKDREYLRKIRKENPDAWILSI